MHRKTINFAIRFNEKRKTKENKHVMQKHIRTNGSSHVSSLVVELTLAMQRVETIKKCDLREIVTLFRHVGNLLVSLCKYGFFVMFLCCHYFQ